ncbi:GNAT family N-acetyltransferase [Allokutzneria sp. A3M-2-11 16]|uniref:GNAT family N-acetyltransferase n=1 Tax=Allokutzneria sp. A3M-2-11 16 TaxID=2962043 RepID=UPI0020B79B50|nr:GNAT family N-acetyltransferase [Allokutzneria sp. A3M-2-11 16]MCP3799719.1 GNAT family N-acetyltransferase [Allokutzneria sp. A3M-2-11 16]
MSERIETTWSLEQTDPGSLRQAKPPAEPVDLVRVDVPSPEFSRFLYTAVGGDWYWTSRLGWNHQRWSKWLEQPGTETWVLWSRGTPAGYVELDAQPEDQVEITCFGLLPGFIGRGLGGHMLYEGAVRAWNLAQRWPQLQPTKRVWVHTCSFDGPAALANYKARGFEVFRVEEATIEVADKPIGPWPGARD